MEIPLILFYYIYMAAVAVFLVYLLFNIYHLLRFGFLTFGTISIIVLYLIGATIILSTSFSVINTIDWNQSWSLLTQPIFSL